MNMQIIFSFKVKNHINIRQRIQEAIAFNI